MKTALDTNVLLDLQGATTALNEQRAYAALRRWLLHGTVVASTIVYSEFSAGFRTQGEVDELLDQMGIEVAPISREAAFIAGQTFAKYRASGGPKQRILPDFLIAGHAIATGAQLLTRDRGFYRRYFRSLKVVDPSEPV